MSKRVVLIGTAWAGTHAAMSTLPSGAADVLRQAISKLSSSGH